MSTLTTSPPIVRGAPELVRAVMTNPTRAPDWMLEGRGATPRPEAVDAEGSVANKERRREREK